jgi:glycosyltransferase involved in cell wall biosynthesis
MSPDRSRFRLAIVASHPVQYYTPWYRALSNVTDLEVFFAHRTTAADHARSGFGVEFEWDVPLFEGYRLAWLQNVATRPGPDRFLGCNTPGIDSVLARGGFDAVLVTGWNLLAYWQAIRAARRHGLPVMVRGDSQLPTRRAAAIRAAKKVAYPRLLRSFDACLAVGVRSEAYYRHYGVPENRIFRSPHCVDNTFFAARAAAARARRDDLRRAHQLPNDAVVFGFAGKMIAKKRPFDFVRAIELAGRTRPAIHGLMIGDGPLMPALRAECRLHAARCTFAGFMNQRDIADAYATVDVLVLPSDAGETWGLVVNEAMACGIPIIASDEVGCAPDLVVAGETGITYRCGDVEALAAAMRRMADAPADRHAMGGRSAEWIAAFSPQSAAAGVVKALETVIARDKPSHSKAERHVVDAVS